MPPTQGLGLGILDTRTEDVVGKIESRIQDESNDILKKYLSDLQQEQVEVEKMKDPVQKAQALNLLNARFKGIQAEVVTDKRDISDLVLGFIELEKELGFQVEELGKPTQAEQARLDRLQAAVTTAEAAVIAAPGKWTFGFIDHAGNAKAAKAIAEKALTDAIAEVNTDINNRIKTSDVEANLARIQARGERAYKALVERHGKMAAQLVIIKKDKDTAFAMARKTKDAVILLDKEITDVQEQLETARDSLAHKSEEDADYLTAKEEVSRLDALFTQKSSDRTAHLGVSREENIYAERFEGYEKSYIENMGNVKAAAAMQQSKNRNIVQQRQHYAKLMEMLSELQMTTKLLRAGNEVDRRLFTTVVRAGAATTHDRQEYMQEQPGRLDEVQRQRAEQDDHLLRAAGIDAKIRADFAEKYNLHGDGAARGAA